MARVIVAAVLFAAAIASWYDADRTRALADAHEQLATLRPLDSRDAPAQLRAIAGYWSGRPDALSDARAPLTLRLAAHAAFKSSLGDVSRSGAGADAFDRALQAYATALKEGGFDRDTAYNYEYVARVRDRMARQKPDPRAAAKPAIAPRLERSDIPLGPTIHGQPGMHPPATRGEEFEILTPMDYGDREAQPEPTPGKKIDRKG